MNRSAKLICLSAFLMLWLFTFLPARMHAADPKPDPGNLQSYRGQNGKSFLFRVTGSKNTGFFNGFVYGDGVYSDDSALAIAAVHAGVLTHGQTGVVKVTIKPGRASYTGVARNGVTSKPFDAWGGSYTVGVAEPKILAYRSDLGKGVWLVSQGGGGFAMFELPSAGKPLAMAGLKDMTDMGGKTQDYEGKTYDCRVCKVEGKTHEFWFARTPDTSGAKSGKYQMWHRVRPSDTYRKFYVTGSTKVVIGDMGAGASGVPAFQF